MRLSTIGLILILGLLTAPPAADAQQRGKVPRIGVLFRRPGSPTPEYERPLDAFRQGVRELFGMIPPSPNAVSLENRRGKMTSLRGRPVGLSGLKLSV